MTNATFTEKGNITKEIKKLLGKGFEVKTNGCGTIVKGDLANAAEAVAGTPFYGCCVMGDGAYLLVWPTC